MYWSYLCHHSCIPVNSYEWGIITPKNGCPLPFMDNILRVDFSDFYKVKIYLGNCSDKGSLLDCRIEDKRRS